MTENIFFANLLKSFKIIICLTENIKHAVQKHFHTDIIKDIVPAQQFSVIMFLIGPIAEMLWCKYKIDKLYCDFPRIFSVRPISW